MRPLKSKASSALVGKGSKLLMNTAVFTAAKFISKLLVLFMTRLYTSCLTTEEYSQADLIVSAANLLIPVACLGIGEGITRMVLGAKENPMIQKAYFTSGLAVYCFGSIVFLAMSPLITLVPMFRDTAWLIVVYVLVSNLHTVVSQYAYALDKTRLVACQGILNTFLTVLLNVLFLPILNFGVIGFVSSVIIADGLTTLFLIIRLRLWRDVRKMPPDKYRILIKEMLRFSALMIPTSICWWITNVSDRYMISILYSEAENGLYAVANKLPTLITLATSVFDSAWKLSVADAERDDYVCTLFYTRVWRHYLTFCFVGGTALIFICRPLNYILVAKEYLSSWIFIPILTVATILCSLDTFLGSVYFTKKKPLWSMITAVFAAGFNILLNRLLIPKWGGLGAAVATLISYLIAFILRLTTVRRLIPFDRKPLISTVNLILLCTTAFAVTATGVPFITVPAAVLWAVAAVCGASVLILNLKPLISLIKDLYASVVRRSSN